MTCLYAVGSVLMSTSLTAVLSDNVWKLRPVATGPTPLERRLLLGYRRGKQR